MEEKIGKENIHIPNSYQYPKCLFDQILDKYEDSEVMKHRTRFSLKMEWAVHNFCYAIGYKRDQTRDVDLDYPCDRPEWIYKICGILCWIFIK